MHTFAKPSRQPEQDRPAQFVADSVIRSAESPGPEYHWSVLNASPLVSSVTPMVQ